MALRGWLNNNAVISTAGATLLLAVALVVLLWSTPTARPGVPEDAFYFDLEHRMLFVGDAQAVPPVYTPAGSKVGVRAQIYACNGCPADPAGMTVEELEAAGTFIAWFERYTDEAKSILERDRLRDPAAAPDPEAEARVWAAQEQGLRIRAADGERWLAVDSDAALRLMEAPLRRCDDDMHSVSICHP